MMVLCLFFVNGSLPAAHGQECGACAASQVLLATSAGSWTLRKQVDEVQVLFTASRRGKYVTGLTPEDVAVRDNDRPAKIVDFRDQDNLPLRVALLVDTSDSIRERFQFEKQAAAIFLRQVLRAESDQGMVAGFNSRLHVTQGFSPDLQSLSGGIARLQPGGRTAIYDAVYQSCQMLAHPSQGMVARVIVVLTDGNDNASQVSRQAAVALAEQDEVTIYTIGTNYLLTESNKNLEQLAAPTGGQALFPGDIRKIGRAFARISDELHHRYAVAYRPPEFHPDGHFRRIRISASKSGKKLKVQARKGYYAR